MAPQETKFNTSFIPKKNPVSSYNSSGIEKRGPSLLSMIGMFIFGVTILGSAAVFIWRGRVEAQIENQVSTLRAAREQFDERLVAEATRLNKRIDAVKTLLDNHVAPTIIFGILEELTLKTVSYNNFSFSMSDDGKILVQGSGEAESIESVVLQSDELGASDFRDVLFDNVQPTNDGNVTFSVEASIDKSIILFTQRRDDIFTFLYDGSLTNNNQ